MNLWKCMHEGCKNECVGMGGAVGLYAIGWYFRPGPYILCPMHRTDLKPIRCERNASDSECIPCAAEKETKVYQELIELIAKSRQT